MSEDQLTPSIQATTHFAPQASLKDDATEEAPMEQSPVTYDEFVNPYKVGIVNAGPNDPGIQFTAGFGHRWGRLELGIDASLALTGTAVDRSRPVDNSDVEGIAPEDKGMGSILSVSTRHQATWFSVPSVINPYVSLMEVGFYKATNTRTLEDSFGLTLAPAGGGLKFNIDENMEADLGARMNIYMALDGSGKAVIGSAFTLGLAFRF